MSEQNTNLGRVPTTVFDSSDIVMMIQVKSYLHWNYSRGMWRTTTTLEWCKLFASCKLPTDILRSTRCD